MTIGNTPPKMTPREMADILWQEYYVLSNTPVDAMEAMWGEMLNIVPWAEQEWGMSKSEVLEAVVINTQRLDNLELSAEAYDGHR